MKSLIPILFTSSMHSDISLKIGNNTYKLHKNILAIHSTFFEALFKFDNFIDLSQSGLDQDIILNLVKEMYSIKSVINYDSKYIPYRCAHEYLGIKTDIVFLTKKISYNPQTESLIVGDIRYNGEFQSDLNKLLGMDDNFITKITCNANKHTFTFYFGNSKFYTHNMEYNKYYTSQTLFNSLCDISYQYYKDH